MTDFSKANMDGSLEREIGGTNCFRNKGKRKRDYTIEVVDENLKVHWTGIVTGAKGTKQARDLWRVQYPEIRKKFLGEGCMVRVF